MDIEDVELPHEHKHPLRVQRERRGWSQRRVAEELQFLFPGVAVSEKEVGRWERRKRTPSPFYREKLCQLFAMDAEQLGLLDSQSRDAESRTWSNEQGPRYSEDGYLLFGQRSIPLSPHQRSQDTLLHGMIERNFSSHAITDDVLSSNIRTMNFRNEWQYVVNNLVSEARMSLRAMVFDVELTKWWNTIAGQTYMMTNIALIKRKVPVRRIFLLSSLDARVRMNTLITAYVHHQIGIEVKICKATSFQASIPFQPDMFSVHDNLYVTLYYFSREMPIANLLLEEKYIAEFTSFYDELFRDDRLCVDIEPFLAHSTVSESFFASVKMQMDMLRTLERVGSVTELVRNS